MTNLERATTPQIAVKVSGLYKIFGTHPKKMLPEVLNGMNKEQLREQFNPTLGLDNIDLEIPQGSIQVIMGLSGSGKSTLVRHFNRLIEPTAGEIWVNDVDVMSLPKRALQGFRQNYLAMVFQRFALLPHYTIVENVMFGLSIKKEKAKIRQQRAQYWIERVGLKGYEDSYPNQLSGGMQQRVGLARALASDVPILLMDEAFSALDPLIRTDMQSMLLDLQQELGKTIIFITHDLEEALRLGDKIAVLREGQIVQNAEPAKIIMHPADDYVKSFVKEVNRGKVIRCKSIMQRPSERTNLPEIDSETTLEDALRQLNAEQADAAHIVSKKGFRIGFIDINTIVQTMLPEEKG